MAIKFRISLPWEVGPPVWRYFSLYFWICLRHRCKLFIYKTFWCNKLILSPINYGKTNESFYVQLYITTITMFNAGISKIYDFFTFVLYKFFAALLTDFSLLLNLISGANISQTIAFYSFFSCDFALIVSRIGRRYFQPVTLPEILSLSIVTPFTSWSGIKPDVRIGYELIRLIKFVAFARRFWGVANELEDSRF